MVLDILAWSVIVVIVLPIIIRAILGCGGCPEVYTYENFVSGLINSGAALAAALTVVGIIGTVVWAITHLIGT